MRTLKFRAWNGKHMVSPMVQSLYLNEWLEHPYHEDPSKPFQPPKSREDIVLMQYTGLKDKNGTDVYEGDIVAFTYKPLAERSLEHGGPKKNREIRWTKNGYNLKRITKEGVASGVEVIGNIYENGDLLK